MNSNQVPLKQNIEKEEYRNIEEVILQNEEKTKCNLKQRKFKKFNYLKYKPANNKNQLLYETMVQHGNSKLSYANVLKQNIYHKPPINNTTDQTKDRSTLQQQPWPIQAVYCVQLSYSMTFLLQNTFKF